MNEDEIILRMDAMFHRRMAVVRALLAAEGRPDLIAELDDKLRLIRLGISRARDIWHSLSPTQQRVLLMLQLTRHLEWSSGSTSRYDTSDKRNVCGIATLRPLKARGLIAWVGDYELESKAVITEHGRFVLKHRPI